MFRNWFHILNLIFLFADNEFKTIQFKDLVFEQYIFITAQSFIYKMATLTFTTDNAPVVKTIKKCHFILIGLCNFVLATLKII
jgi:hypothetical protein